MKPENQKRTVTLTTQKARELGLLRCQCGHPHNNHFPHGKQSCAHCSCKALDDPVAPRHRGATRTRRAAMNWVSDGEQVFLPVMRREAFRDRTIYREATVLCAAGDLCRIQLTDTEQTMWVRVSTLVHPRTVAQLAERALEE